MKDKNKKVSRWAWIPTLYFAEGLPYVTAMTVAVIMYKRMGISNTDIALYTSWLYLPWVIKPFWSPFVDIIKTKRWWIITMQLLIGAGMAGIAFLIPVPFFFQATLAVFWLIAFSSATHDIAADGFYMLALDSSEQSFFVGIRSTFYRLAMITGQGLLIIVAGSMESMTGLEPLHFTVESTPIRQSLLTADSLHFSLPKTNKMTFVAFPEHVMLSTKNISSDSLRKITSFAITENQKNGFIQQEKQQLKRENQSWWSQVVSTPLGNFIKKHFGKEHKNLFAGDGKVGNAALVAIRLTKQPDEGKSVVLNSGFSAGDKSISMISGERLVFTSENWNKPAYVVVQLDYKLKSQVYANFKGISGNIRLAWSITFFILAEFFILFFIYHRFILPYPDSDRQSATGNFKEIIHKFGETFASFFRKKGIVLTLFYLLFYRLGEAMLVKIVSPFMLDAREVGGLGLTTGQVGLVYGTVGILSLTLGGIVGGIAASRNGLKFWLWPMALTITLPQLVYVLLSTFMPVNMIYVFISVAVEQFGYGFGFTAYMLYMIYFSDGEHKTAHFAITTGFMALGMMLPGMIAGWLQDLIGYQHFFIWVILCAIPTLSLIPFMKIDKNYGKKNP